MLMAIKNMRELYASQSDVRGALVARWLALSAYYVIYGLWRLCLMSQAKSHMNTMHALAACGLDRWLVVIQMPEGLTMEIDLLSACFLFKEHLQDRTYEQLSDFVPSAGASVVDVGAHHGLFTIRAARRVGPSGQVIAVEALPENFAILQRNIERNHLTNISAINAAALDYAGRVKLYVSRSASGNNSIVDGSDARRAVEIDGMTLDTMVGKFGMKHVDLLKIDVEGAASKVLEGAQNVLQMHPRIVLEVEGGEEAIRAVRRHLEEKNYRVVSKEHILYASSEA